MNRTKQNCKKAYPPYKKSRAVISVFLVLAIIIVGAYAFLTATDSKTNVFTVGKVDAELVEEFDTNLDGSVNSDENDVNREVYDSTNTPEDGRISASGEILPGQKIIKSPYVKNTGKNKAWVYITVGIPTATSDEVFRDNTTGQTAIAGTSVDIPIKAYAIQENYAGKTSLEDVWNAYFTADKKISVMGAEEKTAANLASRVPLFEILNDQRWTDSSTGNTNDPNSDWQALGSVYRTTDGYDYYVFGYKTLLDAPTTEDEVSKTSFAFKGVKLLSDIGEAKMAQLNYYIVEADANTLGGTTDLSVADEVPDGCVLVKTEYYVPGSKVVSLYFDDTLAKTGYTFNWEFMGESQSYAYSGMTISDNVSLLGVYTDIANGETSDPTPTPPTEYKGTDWLAYSIGENDDGSYFATLVGADGNREDYLKAWNETGTQDVIIPQSVKVVESEDGTKTLDSGVVLDGSLKNIEVGTNITVKRILLSEKSAEEAETDDELSVTQEGMFLGQIAKTIAIPDSVEFMNFSAYTYSGNESVSFALSEVNIPFSCETLDASCFEECTNLKRVELSARLKAIPNRCFEFCESLEEITLPNSVKTIGQYAFYDCNSLKKVDLSDVETIESWSFSGCSALKEISIGLSLKNFGTDVFYYAYSSLDKLNIKSDLESYCKIANGFVSNFTNKSSYPVPLYFNDEPAENLVIPDGTTNIAPGLFYKCKIQSVSFPETLKSIGSNAFCRTNITSVDLPQSLEYLSGFSNTCISTIDIPEGVKEIGDSAFSNCSSLTSVTIPDSVTSIGDWAFAYCGGLTSVTIPDSVTSIGDWAFSNCSGLTSVKIPDSVTNIGEHAFDDCSGLTSVTIPNSVTEISMGLFDSCENLDRVTLSDNITNIGRDAFRDCCKLTEIAFPDSLRKIGEGAFNGCKGLASLSFNEGLEEIEGPAFENCTQLMATLEFLVLPESLKQIDDDYYWSGCGLFGSSTMQIKSVYVGKSLKSLVGLNLANMPSLEQITINEENPNFAVLDKNVYTKDFSEILWCSKDITNLELPEGIKKIPDSAFLNCANLTSIFIPSTVSEIGSNIFNKNAIESVAVSSANAKYDSRDNCNAIIETDTDTLVIGCKNSFVPNGIKNIKYCAFKDCTDITTITIPNSVESIGDSAFSDCSGLTSVEIGNGVTSFGRYAFQNCAKLTDITISDKATSISEYMFYGCSSLTDITIPDSVKSIDGYAFQGCINLQSVSGGANIESIGDSAFSGDAQLSTIMSLAKVKTLGSSAFSFCSKLSSDVELLSLEPIEYRDNGSYAFQGCTSITTVKTSYFSPYMFEGCSNLTSLELTEDCSCFSFGGIKYSSVPAIKTMSQFTIPQNVKKVSGTCQLAGTEIDLILSDIRSYCENSSWGGYSGMSGSVSILYNGEALTALDIPEGTEKIGSGFNMCQTITSVHIPLSVTSIDSDAFYSCKNLTSIQYDGTMADWFAIDVSSWSFASGSAIVCTDGTVTTK